MTKKRVDALTIPSGPTVSGVENNFVDSVDR